MQTRQEVRELLTVRSSLGDINLISLVVPLICEHILNTLIGTVNTAALSGYSQESVSAVGTVNTLINMYFLIFSAISTGTCVKLGNAIGAEKTNEVGQINFTSILLGFSMGIIVTIVSFIISPAAVGFMNLTGDVYEQGLMYLKVRSLGFIISAVYSMFSAILRSYGYAKIMVFCGITANVVNATLNVFVIRNADKCPIPVIAAVALCAVVSNIVSWSMALTFMLRKKIKIKTENIKQFIRNTANILKIGVPSTISSGSFGISQLITNSFIALIGVQAISARVYFNNILSYVYLIGLSIGSANAILISRLCGARDFEHAKRLNSFLTKVNLSINFSLSTLVIIFRKPLVSIFTDNPEIIDLSLAIFLVDIIAELSRAVSQIHEYALRGAGDVWVYMIVLFISCWVIGVGLAYYLSIVCHMGILGCWIAVSLDESVRAGFTYYRWKQGKWQKLHIKT